MAAMGVGMPMGYGAVANPKPKPDFGLLTPFISSNAAKKNQHSFHGTMNMKMNMKMKRRGHVQVLAGLTYKDSGVDIDAGSELVKRIAKMAPGIGGFGGLFPFGIEEISLLLCTFFIYFIAKTKAQSIYGRKRKL